MLKIGVRDDGSGEDSSARSQANEQPKQIPPEALVTLKNTFLILATVVLSALAARPAHSWTSSDRTEDLSFTVLQTTDLHHHANGVDHVGLDVDPITGRGISGSYARIAAYVNYVRGSAGRPVVLVDSGDWTMGTFYDLTLGKQPLALEFLALMRYDCVTLGNHEFDYTSKGLAQMIGAAQSAFGFRTPIVASNLNLNGDADLAPYFGVGAAIQTTRVQTLRNGLKIGYIGLMGRAAAADAPSSAPVSFTPPAAEYPAIQALVNQLRSVQGVQVVIALDHAGTNPSGTAGEDIDLARHVTGIDVIASGHTHTPLPAAQTILNGAWSTRVIDAGAFGTNVSRLDLTYHPASGTTTLDSSSNVAMTDAALAAVHAGLHPDFLTSLVVRLVDQQLNGQLGDFFKQVYPDYNPVDIGTGLYHRAGVSAQDMIYNGADAVRGPNGLGDLAADAVRSVPNSIIAQTLAAVGGNPANMPGYDFTPFQVGVVATGVLRSKLLGGVPLSFADIYNILPLGISPDATQALPVGYPLLSTYLSLADTKKLCALQLLAQSNLASSDFYLNFSGIQYTLKTAESYIYFKYATAASVLQITSQKAAGNSAAALQALGALATLGSDNGAALLAAYAGGNPYAAAMVSLNDGAPSPTNLGVLGQVAVAGSLGGSALSALVVSKAVAAVDTVSGFAVADGENVGAMSPLADSSRVRVAADLAALGLLGALQTQFGVTITPYQSATGTTVLSTADFSGILANRINAVPASGGVYELKEWMALLAYQGSALGGSIGPEYRSTANFTQFASFGPAVQVRNASYPIAGIGRLVSTSGALLSAP